MPIFCKCSFLNYNFLKLHKDKKHKNIYNSCKICGVVIKNKSHVTRHINDPTRTCIRTENYKCTECNVVFKRNDNLITYNHMI